MPIKNTALFLSKHFVKTVKELRDNPHEASKFVTTKALRDMKLSTSAEAAFPSFGSTVTCRHTKQTTGVCRDRK